MLGAVLNAFVGDEANADFISTTGATNPCSGGTSPVISSKPSVGESGRMMGSMIVGSAMMGLLKRTRFLRLIFIGFVSQSEKVRDGVGDRTLVDVELQGECILCDDAADELRQRLLMSS